MHHVTHHLRAIAPIIFSFILLSGLPRSASLLRDKMESTAAFRQLHKHSVPFDQTILGTASWYGRPFHGRLTANGERYDMFHLSAAHKKLPFGSLVRVTNLRNQKSVTVRINDRGPYIQGRSIDLSYQAAQELAMVDKGLAPVRLEIILPAKKSKRSNLIDTARNVATRP